MYMKYLSVVHVYEYTVCVYSPLELGNGLTDQDCLENVLETTSSIDIGDGEYRD